MHATPHILSDRPDRSDDAIDVLGDILGTVHLTTAVLGRLELGAPWRLQIPERDYLSFYVVARGSAWLTLGGSDRSDGRHDAGPTALPLSAGDALVLPRGSAHVLRDAADSDAPPLAFDYDGCSRHLTGDAARLGGSGPVTALIAGQFTFGTAHRNALLDSLPPAIHLPAAATASPQLAGVVPLILSESASPSPGSGIALARLADLLLLHALRHWIATAGHSCSGLRAVADPAIGSALRMMHARPAEPWTVARLAAAVAMSRSAFAARFTELVGEPPLQYLARWRITRAATLLREGEQSVAAVATQVGYANPVAFTKAFSRLQGVGPGTFRRGR